MGETTVTRRPILRMGDERLRQVAAPVEDIAAENIAALVQDMRESVDAVGGSGLAAPQIGIGKRVVIYAVPAGRIPKGATQEPVPWTTMVNPELTPLAPEKRLIWERCLSLPGLYGKVPRYTRVAVRYLDLEGKRIEREAHGFHAMLLQHECDHLDGILYPMRMTDLSLFGFADEITGGGALYPYTPEEFD
jgi:peptide deformylase